MLLFLFILIFCFLTILVWLLLAPIELKIDSSGAVYRIEMRPWLSCRLNPGAEWGEIEMRLLFFKWRYDILSLVMSKWPPEKIFSNENKGEPRQSSDWLLKNSHQRFRRILKTFRIREFYLNLDLHQHYWNGLLFPVFYLARCHGMAVHINFTGQRDCKMVVRNKLGKILMALFF